MSADKTIVRPKLPEEDELERKLSELADLEACLAERELDLSTLQAETRSMELRYLQVVGIPLAELDDLQAQIAEVFAEVHPKDQAAVKEARQARAQSNESATASAEAARQPAMQPDFRPRESIRSLYREAARRIHPDLATDDKDRERRTRLMADVNAAYQAGDEARLRTLLEDWSASPEAVAGEDIAARLVQAIRKIKQIRKRLAAAEDEIKRVEASSLGQLLSRVKVAAEVGRDLLEELAGRLEQDIAGAREHLSRLQAMRSAQRSEQP